MAEYNRPLDGTLVTELTRLDSDHPMVYLFEVNIVGAPGVLYYTTHHAAIVFSALTFTPMGAQVEQLEDATSSTLVTLRVTIQNITQEFSSLCENYWIAVDDPRWYVTVWQIDALQPALTAYGDGDLMIVSGIDTDLISAVVALAVDGLSLSMTIPKRRYTRASGYPSIPMRI